MTRSSRPQYLDDFLAPGRKAPGLGKIIKVLVGTEVIFFLVLGLSASLFAINGQKTIFASDTPTGTILEFAAFAMIIVLFHALVRFIHGRGIETMMGPFRACWNNYKRAFLYVALLSLILSLLPPFVPQSEIAHTRPFPTWLFFALLAIPAVTIQAATEEIIYRGYLMQQFASYRSEKWIWMGLPSIIFGVAHYFNGIGITDGVLLAIWATLLGLCCADLTVRSGNLGAAIGLHAVNNLYALLYIGIENWEKSGLARHLLHYIEPAQFESNISDVFAPIYIIDLVQSIIVLLAMWFAARIAIRR